jgi:hypothetical protein
VSRFRALDRHAPIDEDVRALMADIDASLADLERHLEGKRADERPDGVAPVPPPVPAADWDKSEAAAPLPENVPLPDLSGGFLAELEREADRAQRADEREAQLLAQRQAADARLIHEALGRIFQFFHSFCRYTNTLAPTVDRTYRLDTGAAYSGLTWRDAVVRTRRQSLAETAFFDYVVFRVDLHGAAPVTVTRRWDQMAALRKELQLLDLRPMDEPTGEGNLPAGQARLRLAADFPVQATFRANYAGNRIDLLTRNLEGFGIAAFTCTAADVTQTFLDDLGRYLLARTYRLPAGLSRVHCRAEL